MDITPDYFAANKEHWNQRAAIHLHSAFYNRTGFKEGENVLASIELDELKNVAGKSLLHLQCHFGMDTLNWSRMGACVTGIDLSDKAIEEARQLSEESGIPGRFICSNVYDLKEHLAEQFDIVFTSYGTIGWLPDLDKWAAIVAHYLKPGGIFYMADFHPVVWMFDDEFTHIKYHYDNRETIVMENQATYTGDETPVAGKEYSWNHSISEILNALLHAGLELDFFNEHNFSPYSCFSNTIEVEKDKWQVKGMEGKIPMVYSLQAHKK